MSGIQKILLASTVVVVGYGVAKFLGQPVLVTGQIPPAQQLQSSPAFAEVAAPLLRSTVIGSARLLPEPVARQSSQAVARTASIPDVPMLGTRLESIMPAGSGIEAAALPRTIESVPFASAINQVDAGRARLRDEAPRAVGIDPQSPVAIRRGPPIETDDRESCPVADVRTAPTSWPQPQAVNAEYSGDIRSAPSAVPASYSEVAETVPAAQVGPPPWPAPEANAEPRTHIVVDGDSLERIASRYLSDSQRSRDVFELNRDVLTSPDLLPIGAELKIPDRVASAKAGAITWQPNSSNGKPGNDSVSRNLVPIQPALSPQGIVPRAQLARPVMVQ